MPLVCFIILKIKVNIKEKSTDLFLKMKAFHEFYKRSITSFFKM